MALAPLRIPNSHRWLVMTSLLLCAFLVLPAVAPAQTTPQFASTFTVPGGGNYIPFGFYGSSHKAQHNYLPNEFSGPTAIYPGNITRVYFRRYNAYNAQTYTNFQVQIASVAGNQYVTSTTYHTPMTVAYSAASWTLPSGAANEWFGIDLTTPVFHNPMTNSLIVTVCHDGYTPATYASLAVLTDGPGGNRRIYGGLSCTVTGGSGQDGTRAVFGFDVASAQPNDAGISTLVSPVDFCAGTHDIKIRLRNYGTNTLNSVTINWTYDGVPQAPISWTGALASLAETDVTLGSRVFAPGVSHTLAVNTSNPNGVTDTGPYNDAINRTLKPALSGTFTIGGSSPSYTTFANAVADLNANGICGPVLFNVRPGVYTEQVTMNQIAGASAVNTVTFQSETGNKNDVRLTFNATTTTMHTVLLNGADWVRFRNMTIEGTGVSYARVVTLQSGATNNVFEGNTIRTNPTTSVTTNLCNVYSYYTADNGNQFINNDILNGSYSIYYYGSGTTSLLTGTKWINNRIRDFYYMGFAMWYLDAPEIIGNTIATTNTYTNYLMYTGYLQNQVKVIGNTLIANGTSGTKYGMYVYYFTALPGSEGIITNNSIMLDGGASSTYGIYQYYSNYQNIDFNTIHARSTSTGGYPLYSYYGSNIRYTNNIFHNNTTGYAAYYYYTTFRGMSHNVYFTNGATLAYYNGVLHASIGSLQAASGLDQNSIRHPVTFRNPLQGDLHLFGASQNDLNLTGILQPYVTTDIDGDPRILPYRGADEACYILPNTVTYRTVDGNGNPVAYVEIPGTLYLNYTVAFPSTAVNLTITLRLYTVPANQLAYQFSFTDTKLAGQTLTNSTAIPIPPTLGVGYYRVEVLFNTRNSCGDYIDYNPGDKSLLAVPQGQSPCIVWPGDVTNDGIVNYGDRSALNKYIFDANLRPSWLNGPARYRPDAATNPLTYFTWEGQPAAPWQTPEGCYMDADGNGVVNTYDMLPARVNWMRTHGAWGPKKGGDLAVGTFDLSSNYPNPFNPSTTVQFAVPEKSTVRIVVTDLVGREVAVLVNGTVDTGVHTAVFDASTLESGVYFATARMTGDSGLSFTKSIRMTLSK